MEEDGNFYWDAKEYCQPCPDLPFAIIMLNEALDESNKHSVSYMWKRASVRVCADGATNLYHKFMRNEDIAPPAPSSSVTSGTEANKSDASLPSVNPLPDFITGDFDSAKPELLKLYGSLGVNIVETPDQDETDFTKAVRVLEKHIEEKNLKINHVVIIAGINGERFDHVIANIATLYKVGTLISVPVVVMSGGSLFWLLSIGDHIIQVPDDVVLNPTRSWCGLIPLGQPSTVSTTGLKWDLDNQVLAFGHLVSTSNTYDPTCHGKVTIKTSQPLLWTMGWNKDKFS